LALGCIHFGDASKPRLQLHREHIRFFDKLEATTAISCNFKISRRAIKSALPEFAISKNKYLAYFDDIDILL